MGISMPHAYVLEPVLTFSSIYKPGAHHLHDPHKAVKCIEW